MSALPRTRLEGRVVHLDEAIRLASALEQPAAKVFEAAFTLLTRFADTDELTDAACNDREFRESLHG